MESRRSSSSTGTNEKRNRSLCCSRKCAKERAFSLPTKDRSVKTASPQLLQATEKTSYCENFHFTGFDKKLLKNPLFTEFLSKVNCPICLKAQGDQTILLKHFSEKCSMKIAKRSKLYGTFQIFPSNAIKCNVCPNIIVTTIESYFFHLYDDDHILKCSELINAGKEFVDLLYCACCKMLVSNNYIQLQNHVQSKIHEIRRKSFLKPDYFLSKGIHCVYCFYNANKRFKCLLCPYPNFLFETPWEMMNHFGSSKHRRNAQKNNLLPVVYCCFCNEEVDKFEIRVHFASDEHMKNENSVTPEGSYELCLYCGFACSIPKDLLAHMKSNCTEINKIRQERGWKVNEDSMSNKISRKDQTNNHNPEKKRCILVKSRIKVSKLLKVLKKFGEITCIKTYSDEYLLIEFKNETSVESILLVQDFIKIHKEVDIKFLEEAEEKEADISITD